MKPREILWEMSLAEGRQYVTLYWNLVRKLPCRARHSGKAGIADELLGDV